MLSIAAHADIFIYDAMYTPEEYRGEKHNNALLYKGPRVGWGHSTWLEGTRLAQAAHSKQLILFHHDPEHDDDFLRNLERQAQQVFPKTLLAVEGLELVL